MFRGPVLLSALALVLTHARAPAVELPVIINGTRVAQAPRPEAAPPADKRLPVIINYPSDAGKSVPADAPKSNAPLPVITNLSPPPAKPARPAVVNVVVPLDVAAFADDVAPAAYNVFNPWWDAWNGGVWDGYWGWNYPAAWGYWNGYGYGYPLSAWSAPLPVGPWGFGYAPPGRQILDTGVRANVGRLVSLPSVHEPVYGAVLGVYRVRR